MVHLDGLTGSRAGAVPDGEGGLTDQLVASALRYRAQAPLLDHLLGEIGINAGDPSNLARLLGDLKKDGPGEDKEA